MIQIYIAQGFLLIMGGACLALGQTAELSSYIAGSAVVWTIGEAARAILTAIKEKQ